MSLICSLLIYILLTYLLLGYYIYKDTAKMNHCTFFFLIGQTILCYILLTYKMYKEYMCIRVLVQIPT